MSTLREIANKHVKDLPVISVIIPTYNRINILTTCLQSLSNQDYPKNKFELIVIDDNSSDDTVNKVRVYINNHKDIKIILLTQKHQGPAAARNLGIKKANGDIVLIINDDTIAEQNLITQHAKTHIKHPEERFGVLGYVTWSPKIKITPFMKWLENGGPQFSYNEIKGTNAKWWHLWTCNISFKKLFLIKYGLFDESFPYAAWEDVELGYRLDKHSFKLYFNREAIGYHLHPTTLSSVIDRMKKHGASTVMLGMKVKDNIFRPPLSIEKTAIKIDIIDKIIFNKVTEIILTNIAKYFEKRFSFDLLYNLLLLHYRVVGRREYIKKNAK